MFASHHCGTNTAAGGANMYNARECLKVMHLSCSQNGRKYSQTSHVTISDTWQDNVLSMFASLILHFNQTYHFSLCLQRGVNMGWWCCGAVQALYKLFGLPLKALKNIFYLTRKKQVTKIGDHFCCFHCESRRDSKTGCAFLALWSMFCSWMWWDYSDAASMLDSNNVSGSFMNLLKWKCIVLYHKHHVHRATSIDLSLDSLLCAVCYAAVCHRHIVEAFMKEIWKHWRSRKPLQKVPSVKLSAEQAIITQITDYYTEASLHVKLI